MSKVLVEAFRETYQKYQGSSRELRGALAWGEVSQRLAHRIAWLIAFDCDDSTTPELPELTAEFRKVVHLRNARYDRRREAPTSIRTA